MSRSLWVLALGNFAVGTSALVVAGVLGLVASDLHVSLGSAGAVVTAYSLTYAISAVLLGAVTHRVPRKTLLLVALTLFTIGNLAAALAPNYALLLAARALSAIGASLFTPVASTVAASLVPPELRGRALALVFAGIPVATVLGVPLGTWIGGALGWRTAFSLVVALSVIAFAGIALLVRPVSVPAAAAGAWRALLARPALRGALLVMLLTYVGQFAAYTYLAPQLRTITGLTGLGVTVMLLIFGAAGLLGNAIAGRSTDLWSGPNTLRLGLLVMAASLLLLPLLLPHAWTAALALIAWGVGTLATNPPQQSRMVELAPDAPGAALALNASSIYLGQAIGAPLGGLLAGTHLLWVGPLGGAIVLIAVLLVRRPTPRPTLRPETA